MTIITPILQMRTLRPRKVALAAPGHKVTEWDSKPLDYREVCYASVFERTLLCPGA